MPVVQFAETELATDAEMKDDAIQTNMTPEAEDALMAAAPVDVGLKSTTDDNSGFAKTAQIGDRAFPLCLPEQTFAMVNLAAPHMPTKSTACAIQIVGAFPTREQADEHLDDLPVMATYILPTGKLFTWGDLPLSAEEQLEYVAMVEEKMKVEALKEERLFDQHIKDRQSGADPFKDERERAEFQSKKEQGAVMQEALDRAIAVQAKSKATTHKRVKRLKAVHDVRDQRFAVVSIMHDLDEAPDPDTGRIRQWCVAVWAIFATEREATAHLSDTVQHEQKYHSLFVVKLGEWLYVDLVNTPQMDLSTHGVYRFQQQQDMWSGRETEHINVAAVRKAMTEQGVQEQPVNAAMAAQMLEQQEDADALRRVNAVMAAQEPNDDAHDENVQNALLDGGDEEDDDDDCPAPPDAE
jgi:hypothetical protein